MSRRRVFLSIAPLAIVPFLLLEGCGSEPQSEETENRGEVFQPRGFGKADGASPTCTGFCGKRSPAGCWCDDQCSQFNDCCWDKVTACDNKEPSCAGFCGKQSPQGCWCDNLCNENGDCCKGDLGKAAICDLPADKCADVSCKAPAAQCNGDILTTYVDTACNAQTGQCQSTAKTAICAHGCKNGACEPKPAFLLMSKEMQDNIFINYNYLFPRVEKTTYSWTGWDLIEIRNLDRNQLRTAKISHGLHGSSFTIILSHSFYKGDKCEVRVSGSNGEVRRTFGFPAFSKYQGTPTLFDLP